MIKIDLSVIIKKLNDVSKLVLEEASTLCISRQNKEVTVLHLLTTMIDIPLSDFRIMLKQLSIDHEELKQQLIKYLPNDNSNNQYPVFSPLLTDVLQEAWLLSSTELEEDKIRTGAIFLALLLQSERYLPYELITLFKTVNRDAYRSNFSILLNESVEYVQDKHATTQSKSIVTTDHSNLDKYTVNYTLLASQGQLDPVLDRDEEINLMIDILCRRRKNNPIVVGDPGVGKSALIEGLAQKIVDQKVPDKLLNVQLLSLDLGALQAGASVKGEFEKRLKGIINEVKESSQNIILFIDEAHTLIGAGNGEGSGDAANLLKPALARGELKTIAATTWKEYKKYFEKDAALTRRFQLVSLSEPTADQTVNILRGLHSIYEQSHHVLISDDALKAAASLSERYISGRKLPDKAIDVLDTACARIAINFNVPPKEISKLRNELSQISLEKSLLNRELDIGNHTNADRVQALIGLESQIVDELAEKEQEWSTQKKLVEEIIELKGKILESIEKNKESSQEQIDVADDIKHLKEKEKELSSIPANQILVYPMVDEVQIASVISDWTGIPVNKMNSDELNKITNMPDYLSKYIKGQDLAISKIHQHMLTSRADLRRTGRPKGAFLLVGPSGVGKTESVLQIAELLYGGKQFLTVINMSEYQEKHTVSRLLGSPPGYVGYGEGGVLTEAIRQKPYSVVLLDEVEKAHPEVLNIFYQAFDKGEIADGEGRVIDCQNIIFFLTSNLGYQTIVDYGHMPKVLDEKLYPELAAFFKPALLARMETVPYFPLNEDTLKNIIQHKLEYLKQLFTTRYAANTKISDDLIEEIFNRATRSENGARMLESIIDGHLLPPLSLELLTKLANKENITEISLGVADGEFVCHVQ